MLTQRVLQRVAGMMQAYGELRPGFVDHERANMAGPTPSSRHHSGSGRSSQPSSEKPFVVTLTRDANGEACFKIT